MQADGSAIGVLCAFLCLLTSNLLRVLIRGMNRSLRWGGRAFSLSSLQSYYYQMLVRLGMELIVTSCRQRASALVLRLEGTKVDADADVDVDVDVQLSCVSSRTSMR